MSCESQQKGFISSIITMSGCGWGKHLFISFQILMIHLSHSSLCLPAKISVFCVSPWFLFKSH